MGFKAKNQARTRLIWGFVSVEDVRVKEERAWVPTRGRENVRAGGRERECWALGTHVGCKGKIWSQRQVETEEATGSEGHRAGFESHF